MSSQLYKEENIQVLRACAGGNMEPKEDKEIRHVGEVRYMHYRSTVRSRARDSYFKKSKPPANVSGCFNYGDMGYLARNFWKSIKLADASRRRQSLKGSRKNRLFMSFLLKFVTILKMIVVLKGTMTSKYSMKC